MATCESEMTRNPFELPWLNCRGLSCGALCKYDGCCRFFKLVNTSAFRESETPYSNPTFNRKLYLQNSGHKKRPLAGGIPDRKVDNMNTPIIHAFIACGDGDGKL